MILGVILTTPCRVTRDASAELNGRALTVTVEVEVSEQGLGGCVDAPIFIEYEATVLELDQGVYDLNVVHERLPPNQDQDVFSGRVEVT